MIELTDGELEVLIEESIGCRMLSLRFGPRFTALEDVESNAWAVARVQELRRAKS